MSFLQIRSGAVENRPSRPSHLPQVLFDIFSVRPDDGPARGHARPFSRNVVQRAQGEERARPRHDGCLLHRPRRTARGREHPRLRDSRQGDDLLQDVPPAAFADAYHPEAHARCSLPETRRKREASFLLYPRARRAHKQVVWRENARGRPLGRNTVQPPPEKNFRIK